MKRVTVTLVCDHCLPAQVTENVTAERFVYSGKVYKVDLCSKSRDDFRTILRSFGIELAGQPTKARQLSAIKPPSLQTTSAQPRNTARRHSAEIRAWAQDPVNVKIHGFKPPADRGLMSNAVLAAYDTDHLPQSTKDLAAYDTEHTANGAVNGLPLAPKFSGIEGGRQVQPTERILLMGDTR